MSKCGEITCLACGYTLMNLRSITENLKEKYHTNALENRKKDAEIQKGPDKIHQARVDIIIIRQIIISPEVVRYRINSVWSSISVNIDISSLEDLDESYYKRKYEDKQISLGHISHISDYIIPLVHAEDLFITEKILRPENRKKKKTEQIF